MTETKKHMASRTGKDIRLKLGWLYPDLMSTYGDRGNVMVFRGRAAARGVEIEVVNINVGTPEPEIRACDLIFGGGAQDRQQTIVISDLRERKGPVLREMFGNGTVGLFVCGSPQLLGHSYMTGDGETLKGLDIFDMESRHFGKDKPRCIGNTVGDIGEAYRLEGLEYRSTIVGFENHGGRTYLGNGVKPFARVLVGNGNNGEDGLEGAVFKNCIATYYHGPFLAKNPHLSDWLLAVAMENRTGKKPSLLKLDDTFEWHAHDVMLKRLMPDGKVTRG